MTTHNPIKTRKPTQKLLPLALSRTAIILSVECVRPVAPRRHSHDPITLADSVSPPFCPCPCPCPYPCPHSPSCLCSSCSSLPGRHVHGRGHGPSHRYRCLCPPSCLFYFPSPFPLVSIDLPRFTEAGPRGALDVVTQPRGWLCTLIVPLGRVPDSSRAAGVRSEASTNNPKSPNGERADAITLALKVQLWGMDGMGGGSNA